MADSLFFFYRIVLGMMRSINRNSFAVTIYEFQTPLVALCYVYIPLVGLTETRLTVVPKIASKIAPILPLKVFDPMLDPVAWGFPCQLHERLLRGVAYSLLPELFIRQIVHWLLHRHISRFICGWCCTRLQHACFNASAFEEFLRICCVPPSPFETSLLYVNCIVNTEEHP